MTQIGALHLKHLIEDSECPEGCHCSQLAISELPPIHQIAETVFLCEGHHEHPCVHRMPHSGHYVCGCLRRTRLYREFGI